MALRPCPECGHLLATSATVCPSCGAQNIRNPANIAQGVIGLVVGVILLWIAVQTCAGPAVTP